MGGDPRWVGAELDHSFDPGPEFRNKHHVLPKSLQYVSAIQHYVSEEVRREKKDVFHFLFRAPPNSNSLRALLSPGNGELSLAAELVLRIKPCMV